MICYKIGSNLDKELRELILVLVDQIFDGHFFTVNEKELDHFDEKVYVILTSCSF
ncbi:hypothetical protein BOFE_08600 (plasmid) [Candidatus Borrelia fainii]|uniref:Uncharacterized protein n=1 Tax=Candidatus Borrelia fainii TaxID=2518322 RepID=A0ABM8DL42_9SPIR|nr:hypothetical protein [Candidatus Borrelia fainii]BDU63320.1 hypothetical protein BOFE_08600 [Candidatus Borrelia fainii]